MALEDLTGSSKFINNLVSTNPAGTDAKSDGDNHLRGIKNVLLNTFPNTNAAVTSSDEELNLLDGVTSTTAELNILDGVTSVLADFNKLAGVTSTVTELNYTDGVTSAIQTQLNTKATSISPSLTGIPTSVTPTANDNTTKVATTAYVQTELTGLIGGAPGALDTLNELAAAINDDASFASTITTSLGLKAPLASPVFTGSITIGSAGISEAELEILDGATLSTLELNKLDGVTATTAELNKMDGITSTTTELNYTDGVTSSIQTQLGTLTTSVGTKQATLVNINDTTTANGFGARTISTSSPSAGSNGDVHYQV